MEKNLNPKPKNKLLWGFEPDTSNEKFIKFLLSEVMKTKEKLNILIWEGEEVLDSFKFPLALKIPFHFQTIEKFTRLKTPSYTMFRHHNLCHQTRSRPQRSNQLSATQSFPLWPLFVYLTWQRENSHFLNQFPRKKYTYQHVLAINLQFDFYWP